LSQPEHQRGAELADFNLFSGRSTSRLRDKIIQAQALDMEIANNNNNAFPSIAHTASTAAPNQQPRL
jgi:hypothetical protein